MVVVVGGVGWGCFVCELLLFFLQVSLKGCCNQPLTSSSAFFRMSYISSATEPRPGAGGAGEAPGKRGTLRSGSVRVIGLMTVWFGRYIC